MTAVLKATLGAQGLPGEENALGYSPGECEKESFQGPALHYSFRLTLLSARISIP